MNDFRQNILNDSLARLRSLQAELNNNFSDSSLREAFRIIHSLKGISQTFGFKNAAQIAENIENFLAAAKSTDFETKNILSSKIGLLIDSLKNKNFRLSADFVEKAFNQPSTSGGQIFLTQIPPYLFKKFSANEKKKIISAYRDQKNIFAAEVAFEKSNFAKSFQAFQQKILQAGEIIAVLPDGQIKNSEKLKFIVVFSNAQNQVENLQSATEFSSHIISYNLSAQKISQEWLTMLLQVVEHHEKTAKRLKKQVILTIFTNDVRISESSAQKIFEILLHLIRNSLVHAFDKYGEIEVLILADGKNLRLDFADNGKGIDLMQVKRLAIEKKIIPSDAELTEQQTLELIFAPEFSTAKAVSAIAGRGVGLDIVKNAVQGLKGKISVRSRKDRGTKFEIILPII